MNTINFVSNLNDVTMKAVLFSSKAEGLKVIDVSMPAPSEGEIVIRLHYAALNHLDLLIWKEQTLSSPVISGSDGSGIVHAIGSGVDERWLGKAVIVNPGLSWGNNEKIHSEQFQILGNPTNGTLAEYIVIPKEYVYEKPVHLSLQEAAALPLAALTAFRALFTKAQTIFSDKILITGIGGGAALFLLQMAVAIGAEVYVTSSSNEKLQKAIAQGAKGGFNYKDPAWVQQGKEAAGGFDVVVDSAAGDGFAQLAEAANPAARIVLFGRTAGNINNLSPRHLFNKQLQIMGTLMGTPNEFKAMLGFYERYQLHPVIDREFSLDDITEARHYMETGNHFGKIILNLK